MSWKGPLTSVDGVVPLDNRATRRNGPHRDGGPRTDHTPESRRRTPAERGGRRGHTRQSRPHRASGSTLTLRAAGPTGRAAAVCGERGIERHAMRQPCRWCRARTPADPRDGSSTHRSWRRGGVCEATVPSSAVRRPSPWFIPSTPLPLLTLTLGPGSSTRFTRINNKQQTTGRTGGASLRAPWA